MNNKNVEVLYNAIVENSWTDNIENYLDFLGTEGSKYVKSDEELWDLVDQVLKKILSNLKNNVKIDKYDNIILNMGRYSNQDGYDFAVGVIKSYYRDDFVINGTEYSVMDMLNTVVEQYKTEDTLPIPEIFHYILASIFRLHYALYIREQKKD